MICMESQPNIYVSFILRPCKCMATCLISQNFCAKKLTLPLPTKQNGENLRICKKTSKSKTALFVLD